MTREEAIYWLRRYRRSIPRFNYGFGVLRNNPEFLYQSFEQHIVATLIDKIQIFPNRDPINIVYRVYVNLDEVLSCSDDDHFITHNCASMMERITRDILRYLREKEIRKHEQN